MQTFINAKPVPTLSPRDEAGLAGAPPAHAVSATILSVDEAVRRVARLGAALDMFLFIAAAAALAGAGAWQALAAEDFDKPTVTYGLLALAVILVALAFVARTRRAVWPARLAARASGLPPPGSLVSADATGLYVGDRTWPWTDVRITELHVVRRSAGDGPVDHQIERLVLEAGGTPLVLDTLLMRSGQPVLDAVYRRVILNGAPAHPTEIRSPAFPQNPK
jgi:hypothetical protein